MTIPIAFVCLSLLLIFAIIILVLTLITKHITLCAKFSKLNKYLYNYVNTITSARYGNLNSKIDKGIDALTIQLSRNTNALLESIIDRDKMIKEYIEKEKQTNSIKQDFTSSLAHDLKVPIIAQDNTYDLLLNEKFGVLTELQRSVVENLKISNNDLKNLVVDLLDAHKLDSQKLVLTTTKTNINNLIRETIKQSKSILTIQNKKIIFEEQSQIEAEVDSFLIKRILNNLISNAIYYGKNTENITIRLKSDENFFTISIIDEGDGIDEKNINDIFNKYYTSAKKYSNIGIGLGLYIANKIAIAHNGKLLAKNVSPKGACFDVVLPIKNC